MVRNGDVPGANRNSLDPRTAGALYRIHTNQEIAVFRAGVTGCKGRRGFLREKQKSVISIFLMSLFDGQDLPDNH